MAMQGPHQGAQKSTTTGTPLRLKCLSKFAAVSSMGLPSNKAEWHLGQRGASLSRSLGSPTTESQCPQTTAVRSLIQALFGLGHQNQEAVGDDRRAGPWLIFGRRRRRSE